MSYPEEAASDAAAATWAALRTMQAALTQLVEVTSRLAADVAMLRVQLDRVEVLLTTALADDDTSKS